MFSELIGALLKNARKQLNLSRDELARRGGVSTRLVAEFERGQRPNVSLESALKLLNVVGVSVIATAPSGATAEIRDSSVPGLERAARAARRRETWTGGHIHLHDEGESPRPGRSKAKRILAVSQVSRQAYLAASAGRGDGDRATVHSRSTITSRGHTAHKRQRTSRSPKARSTR